MGQHSLVEFGSEQSYQIIREAYKKSMQLYHEIKQFLEDRELIPRTGKDVNIINRLCNMIYCSDNAISLIDSEIRKQYGMSLNQFISEYSHVIVRDRAVKEIIRSDSYSIFKRKMEGKKVPFIIKSDGRVVLPEGAAWLLSVHIKWDLAQHGISVTIE